MDDAVAALGEARRRRTTVPRARRDGGRRRRRARRRSQGPSDARDVAAGRRDACRRAGSANAAALVGAGRLHGAVAKRQLPNYSVFDEQRWFLPGSGPGWPFVVGGGGVGVAGLRGRLGRPRSGRGARRGGRRPPRRAQRLARTRAAGAASASRSCGAAPPRPAARSPTSNLVGGQDELVFDGGQPGRRPRRTACSAAAPQFAEHLLVVDVEVPDATRRRSSRCLGSRVASRPCARRSSPRLRPTSTGRSRRSTRRSSSARATTSRRTGSRTAVIALSGGIDSSLVATIAVDALGADAVLGVSMPSRYSSAHSRSDAVELAARLGIRCDPAPIEPAHAALADSLADVLGAEPAGLTDENLQSRIRGVLLMAHLERDGRDRAHDGEQVRARDGVLHALRRLRRRVRRHQGRREDPRLRAVPAPQRA